MNNIEPNKILFKTLDLLETLPYFLNGDNFSILVRFTNKFNIKLIIVIDRYIDESFILKYDNQEEKIYSKDVILKIIKFILKKHYIYDIDFNSREQSNNLFYCNDQECLEVRKIATKTIQKEFRKSKEYAAWEGHPLRLKKLGYFKV